MVKKTTSKKEEKVSVRVEQTSGSFYRQFSLPDTADEDKVFAQSKHGVLEIIIPKSKQSKTRKIEIK